MKQQGIMGVDLSTTIGNEIDKVTTTASATERTANGNELSWSIMSDQYNQKKKTAADRLTG